MSGLIAEAPSTRSYRHHCRQRCRHKQAAAIVQALLSNAAAPGAELDTVAVDDPAPQPPSHTLSIEPALSIHAAS